MKPSKPNYVLAWQVLSFKEQEARRLLLVGKEYYEGIFQDKHRQYFAVEARLYPRVKFYIFKLESFSGPIIEKSRKVLTQEKWSKLSTIV